MQKRVPLLATVMGLTIGQIIACKVDPSRHAASASSAKMAPGENTPGYQTLSRPSRSTAVDIDTDDQVIAMVNTDDGTVSFFDATLGQERLTARLRASAYADQSQPIAVLIHPDQDHAFVINRATKSVSRFGGIRTQPVFEQETELDGELMGAALTPTGARLYVTDWVSGIVYALDTSTLAILQQITVGGNPFAVAITNSGSGYDDGERVLVTQFYGRARSGVTAVEGRDDGKVGVVQVIDVGGDYVRNEILLSPIASCFTGAVGATMQVITSGCYPNQLFAINVHSAWGHTRAYVASVAASPEGPVSFNHNMQAVVSVIDLDAEAELPALTKNLNSLIKDQQIGMDPTGATRVFLNQPNAIDFEPGSSNAVAYVTSGGSDLALRVEYRADDSVVVGSPLRFNTSLGQNPQGIVVRNGAVTNGVRAPSTGAVAANLISRDLSLMSFSTQAQSRVIVSSAQPTDPTTLEFKIWKGKRFFNTSTGIWSKEGWGSCQGCHPFGLSDNVTWKFAAGPRQTIALDGQYAKNDPSDMRALNWTGIFDETHDFENNTRGVSGGKGAIQDAAGNVIVSPMGPPFSSILIEDQRTRENHQALNGSLKFITRNRAICSNANTCPDWDLIDLYVQSIKSARGVSFENAAIVAGRTLFQQGGCDLCHAGPKWTTSRTFYRPEAFRGAPPSRVFDVNRAATVAINTAPLNPRIQSAIHDPTLIAADDSTGTPALKRQACNLRDVGTFGVMGGADETRDNGTPAQGRNGFNPPSLMSLAVSAPYFHNGAAQDLYGLFDPRFAAHLHAGNASFDPQGWERDSLVALLLSIDSTTPPFPVRADTQACPLDFSGP